MTTIITIGDLKNLIKSMDNDLTLEMNYMMKVSYEELRKMSHPYPWRRIKCNLEFNDVGHSEKTVRFGVYDKDSSGGVKD